MTFQRWLLVPATALLLSALGDRIHMENRITTVESAYKDIQSRLDRIEGKVDQLVQRGENAR